MKNKIIEISREELYNMYKYNYLWDLANILISQGITTFNEVMEIIDTAYYDGIYYYIDNRKDIIYCDKQGDELFYHIK